MKRITGILLMIFLLFAAESAFAAKARSIHSEADSTHHSNHLQYHVGNTGCHATGNYIKTRTKAGGNKVIGHLEQADEFMLLEMDNGWALIKVTFSAKTSPDSWVGMTGWVNSDYIDCDCGSSDYLRSAGDLESQFFLNTDWKKAYRKYISENHLMEYLDDYAEYWLVYIDNDSIPELLIDTGIVAGGCHVLSYQDGQIAHTLIGSTGTPSYIEKENLLLDSAGHQGCYYDTVYQIVKGSWVVLYHAENFEIPSPTYDQDHQCLYTYFINNTEVDKDVYISNLKYHFDYNKATHLITGTSIAYLDDALR